MVETSEASLGWLMEHLRLSPKDIEGSFQARFRLQKAAFLLRHLGVHPLSEYEFDSYVHGPHSSALARQCYSILPGGTNDLSPEVVGKLDWFVGHSDSWIEIASSMLSVMESNPRMSDEDILGTLRLSKPWIIDAEFEEVKRELGGHGIIGR